MLLHRYIDVIREDGRYCARPNFEVSSEQVPQGFGDTPNEAIQNLEQILMSYGVQKGSYEFRLFSTPYSGNVRRIKIENEGEE